MGRGRGASESSGPPLLMANNLIYWISYHFQGFRVSGTSRLGQDFLAAVDQRQQLRLREARPGSDPRITPWLSHRRSAARPQIVRQSRLQVGCQRRDLVDARQAERPVGFLGEFSKGSFSARA